MKNDQYFRLNATMMANDSILILIDELGMEAYGIYIALLGELRQRDDYTCGVLCLPALARRWNTEPQMVHRVVTDFGLFLLDPDESSFSSPYLDDSMQKLEEKRRQSVQGGTVRAATAERSADGRFTSAVQPEEKSLEEKEKEEEEEKEETPAAPAIFSSHEVAQKGSAWEACIDSAFLEQSWVEIQAMHSGMSRVFVERRGVGVVVRDGCTCRKCRWHRGKRQWHFGQETVALTASSIRNNLF